MPEDLSAWRSSTGEQNAVALRADFGDVFVAMAEYDWLGHLVLHRAAQGGPKTTVEAIVGIALLRRGVTLFAGIRELLEASLADPAVLLTRTYFELWLQYRCLAYGTQNPISFDTSTASGEREPRAIRFYVASARRGLRSRALIVGPEARHPPDSPEGGKRLEEELVREIERLKSSFPGAWAYFGELKREKLASQALGDPAWFADLIKPKASSSIEKLATALGATWEYDFLYEAWSAFAHGRGISKDMTREGNGMAVHHPHRPTWFAMVAFLSLTWHSLVLMTAAKWLTPITIPDLQKLHSAHQGTIKSLEPDDAMYAEFID